MKKIWKIFALAALLVVSLSLFAACEEQKEPPAATVYYNVTFDTDGGSEVVKQSVRENGRIYRPSDPEKDGFGFVDWYHNGEPFRFRTKVTGDITLVAKWGPCEAVVSQKLVKPEGWDFAELTVKDENAAPVQDCIVEYDGQFCFVEEGEYKIYKEGSEPVGHYLISDFTLTLKDFDKAGQMAYGEFTIGGKTGNFFKWNNAVYQPSLFMENSTFDTLVGYCDVKGYDMMRISVYPILHNNGVVAGGKYFVNNTWTTHVIPVADLQKLEKFEIWSQSEGLTEMFFTMEFFRDGTLAPYFSDFVTYVGNTPEYDRENQMVFHFNSGERYQPMTTLSASGIEWIKDYAAENGYNRLRIICPNTSFNFQGFFNKNQNLFNTDGTWGWGFDKTISVAELTDLQLWTWNEMGGASEDFVLEFSYLKDPVVPASDFENPFADRPFTLNYIGNKGDYTAENQFVYSFSGNAYQPTAQLSAEGIAKIKAYAEENGYDTLRCFVYTAAADDFSTFGYFNENLTGYNTNGAASTWHIDKSIAISELTAFSFWTSVVNQPVSVEFVLEFIDSTQK
ncbi:MAG: hypothetical protein DBX59_12195 [Bacillota bacterium]|nr:MAG: hypothetical protein DBX59_12195 [Bacillota bacterium]